MGGHISSGYLLLRLRGTQVLTLLGKRLVFRAFWMFLNVQRTRKKDVSYRQVVIIEKDNVVGSQRPPSIVS